MPRRKRTIKVDSSQVQGKDSWAEVSKMTMGEIKVLRKQSQQERKARKSQLAKLAKRNPDWAFEDMQELVGDDTSFEVGADLIIDHVIAWNWADENGEPLPQPQDDRAVFDDLTDDEFGFLADAVRGDEEVRKN